MDKKKLLALFAISLVSPFLFEIVAQNGWFDLIENRLSDMRFRYFNFDKKPSPDVVLVYVDEQTIEKLGVWPIPRNAYIPVINFLNTNQADGKGPKGIFFDVFFTEKSAKNNSLIKAADEFNKLLPQLQTNTEIKASLAQYQKMISDQLAATDYDLRLAETMGSYKNIFNNVSFLKEDDPLFKFKPLPPEFVQKFSFALKSQITGQAAYNNYIIPIEPILKSTSGITLASFTQDNDRVSRHNYLYFKYGQQFYPSFALAAYLSYKGLTYKDLQEVDDSALKIGDLTVPLKNDRFVLHHYHQKFTSYSFAKILQEAQGIESGDLPNPEETMSLISSFDGKIVIMGVVAQGGFDEKVSPLGTVPGPELHATVISNLIQKDFLVHFPQEWVLTGVLLLTMTMGALILFYQNFFTQLLLPLTSIGLFLAFNLYTFQQHSWVIPLFMPLLSLLWVAIASFAYISFTEGKDKKFLKEAFGNYISPELIEQMYSDKQPPKLGGDSGVRTAFFTDIQGFSSFSEVLSATKLVELLNEYLTVMTDILLAEKGTLDKYEGDAIIAFFGAPMPLPDHAVCACRTAVKMQLALDDLRVKWQNEGDKWPQFVKEMKMRVGINSGEIVTGNMGSKNRMNYTMMGDSVNLAARLEASAKQYGVYNHISQFNRALIGEEFVLRELDNVRVVGKQEAVTTYELLGIAGQTAPHLIELKEKFETALALYKQKHFLEAKGQFEAILDLEKKRDPIGKPKTNPSLEYIERCDFYLKNPPPADWDCVWVLTSK